MNRLFLSGARVSWTPYLLPRSLLYAYWDAAHASTMLATGAAVSSWKDETSIINTAQVTDTARPTLVNGWIYGDGQSRCLQITPVPSSIPTGTNPVWDWMVIDQTLPGSVAGGQFIGAWGTNSSATRRAITREIDANNVNRASFRNGSDIATNPYVDFSGKHVVCAKSSGTVIEMLVDGVGMGAVPSTSNIGTSSNLRHLASASTTASLFFAGGMAVRLITAPLSATVEAQLLAYLMARRSI